MLTRSRLLLAATAPALAVVLSGVTPAQAAPISYTAVFHAEAQVTLPDGRGADVLIDRYLGGTAATTFTDVEVNIDCESIRDCSTGGWSVVELAGDEARFTPGLGRVTLVEVPMTLHGWTGRNASQQVDTPMTVSAVLTATGPLAATVNRGSECLGPSATNCVSVGMIASRPVRATVTINGTAAAGTGSVSSGRTLSVVVPR